MSLIVLVSALIIVCVIIIEIIKKNREYKIDMELAKHGTTRNSAKSNHGTSSRKKKSSSKSKKQEVETETITKITNPRGNEYKVYGTGNRVICTTEIEGDLIGWGKDYFVVEDRKHGRVYTYDAEGDEIGWNYLSEDEHVCSVALRWYTVQKKGFSIKKKYDRKANFIESK